MKYLKYFETELWNDWSSTKFKKQFREVDLQLLLDDYFDFEGDNVGWRNICEKFKPVLETMLLDKEVEFLRVIHPIDGEPIYSQFGRVKSINLIVKGNYLNLLLNIYGEEGQFIIKLGVGFTPNTDKPEFIKIYNSKQTDIEKQIELEKYIKKYNL